MATIIPRVVTILLNHQREFKTGGLTPMHLACQKGHHQVVDEIARLVHVWIDAANRYQDMYTPLHTACECSHKNVMDVLLEHKAKVCFTKKESLSPLHLAVKKGFADGLELLLNKRPDYVNCTDNQLRTPLHYAGEHCHKSNIITLLHKRLLQCCTSCISCFHIDSVVYFREGNLGALDRNSFTPILTAAAFDNHDAFNTMVDLDEAALRITLFQAAKHPDKSTFQALEVGCINKCVI